MVKLAANGGRVLESSTEYWILVPSHPAPSPLSALLSAILHPEDGEYEEGAVEFWHSLRKKFGDELELVAEAP